MGLGNKSYPASLQSLPVIGSSINRTIMGAGSGMVSSPVVKMGSAASASSLLTPQG